MIGNRLTQTAERAAQRYRQLLAGFDGIYHQALSVDPGTSKSQRRATQDAYQLADAYLSEEAIHIDESLSLIRNDASFNILSQLSYPDSVPSEEVVKHVEALGTDLDAALRVQIERDVASILKGLRGVALRASIIATGRNIPRSSALKIVRADKEINFTFQDRAGRNYPSAKYVRTVWRKALVQSWNETALLTLAANGETVAEIQHPDESHEWQGELLSLTEEGTLPTWNDVQEDVFHPNTEAWVSAATHK